MNVAHNAHEAYAHPTRFSRFRAEHAEESAQLKRERDSLSSWRDSLTEYAKRVRADHHVGKCVVCDDESQPVVCPECDTALCDGCLLSSLEHGAVKFVRPDDAGTACVKASCLSDKCQHRVTVADLLAGRRDAQLTTAIIAAIVAQASVPVVEAATRKTAAAAFEDATYVSRSGYASAALALYGEGHSESLIAAKNTIERVKDLAAVAQCPKCDAHLAFRLPSRQEKDCMSMKCPKCETYVCSMCLADCNEDGTPFDWQDVHEHVTQCECRYGLRDDGDFVHVRRPPLPYRAVCFDLARVHVGRKFAIDDLTWSAEAATRRPSVRIGCRLE